MSKSSKILAKLNLLLISENLETASIQRLFHNTSPNKALSILKDEAFRLPLSETNISETQGREVPALYYLSTARSITSGYISDRGKHLGKVNDSVTFVIDTAKLRQKNRGIKIKSYEYWGKFGATGRNLDSAREMEERIYSNNRNLKIRGCITVLLTVREDKYINNFHLRNVFAFCLKNKIPCKLFTYDNLSGFKLLREDHKDRQRAIEILKTSKREHPYARSFKGKSPERSKTLIKFYDKGKGRDSKYFTDLDVIRMLVDKQDYRDIPSKIRSRLFYNYDSFTKYFDSYLHNLRGDIAHGSDELDKLDSLIKRMKVKTVSDFFKALEIKWEALKLKDQEREQAEWEAKNGRKQVDVWSDAARNDKQ